jgi:hypothetical protein
MVLYVILHFVDFRYDYRALYAWFTRYGEINFHVINERSVFRLDHGAESM